MQTDRREGGKAKVTTYIKLQICLFFPSEHQQCHYTVSVTGVLFSDASYFCALVGFLHPVALPGTACNGKFFCCMLMGLVSV